MDAREQAERISDRLEELEDENEKLKHDLAHANKALELEVRK